MANARSARIVELEGTVVDEMAKAEATHDERQRIRAWLTRMGEEV